MIADYKSVLTVRWYSGLPPRSDIRNLFAIPSKYGKRYGLWRNNALCLDPRVPHITHLETERRCDAQRKAAAGNAPRR